MARTVVLHIGTHRTGTTSIQQALADERQGLLARVGFRFPETPVMRNIHVELQFASTRPDRLEALARFYDWMLEKLEYPIRHCQDRAWFDTTRAAIAGTDGDRLVYSVEGLSLLRYPDEIERVVSLFDGSDLSVVMFVRDPAEFLRSYEWSMQVLGLAMSDDPDSILYVGPGSWLVDYETRTDLWRSAIGASNVRIVSYEECMASDGSTVPAMFEALGIARADAVGLDRYFLNARPTG
jgi:hypothetical protein